MMFPLDISWAGFEAKYKMYPRVVFHLHTYWNNKHTEWIALLELKHKTFYFMNIATRDAEREAATVVWAKQS